MIDQHGPTVVFTFYTLATLAYLGGFIFPRPVFGRVGIRLAGAGLVVHAIILFRMLAAQGYPFLLHPAQTFSFISWFTLFAFVILGFFYRLSPAGPFFLVTCLVFLILAVVEGGSLPTFGPLLQSPWAALHLFFMFLAFSVLLTSVMTGIIFYLQEIQIKARRPAGFFAGLPALEVIDRIHARALGVGFILLSLGILSGGAWSYQMTGSLFVSDIKRWWALISWALYFILLNFRFAAGWRGRRGVLLSILGFAALVFTFLGVDHRGITP